MALFLAYKCEIQLAQSQKQVMCSLLSATSPRLPDFVGCAVSISQKAFKLARSEIRSWDHAWLLCRCDVSSWEECSHLSRLTTCRSEAILHASGILNDAMLRRQDAARVREVYAPKYYGAVNLVKVRYWTLLYQTKLLADLSANY